MADHEEFIDHEKYVRMEIPVKAFGQPQFIIESHGVYYLTVGVWAYDPKAANGPVQVAAVTAIAEQFRHLTNSGAHRDAVEVPQLMQTAMATHTGPPSL